MILIRGNVERMATDEALVEKLERDGFRAVGGAPKQSQEEEKPLAKMKVDELKALAKEKGVEGANSLTREELLAVLKDVSIND